MNIVRIKLLHARTNLGDQCLLLKQSWQRKSLLFQGTGKSFENSRRPSGISRICGSNSWQCVSKSLNPCLSVKISSSELLAFETAAGSSNTAYPNPVPLPHNPLDQPDLLRVNLSSSNHAPSRISPARRIGD